MHQHPRPPPPTASPANSDQTNPTRTNNPRDREVQALRTASTQGSGSSEDFATARQESTSDNNPAAQMQRLNQVIQNFHTKAALIILHSRVDLPEAYSAKSSEKRVNRWFNIELDETDEYNDEIRLWRKCDLKANRPPPLVIEIYLATDILAQGQRLVILDDEEKRWDVSTALASTKNFRGKKRASEVDEVVLERWTIELGEQMSVPPADLTSILPLVYKKSIVLFRSLYTYCNFLPTWKLSRKVGRSRHNMAMRIGYRILDGSRMQEYARMDNLETPLYDSSAEVTNTYSFGVTDSPAGPFSVEVRYRENCDFRIDDTEELLSSRFLGADDDLFRPSLPHDDQSTTERDSTRVGSLPNDERRHLRERPELGHAYGSLSTFHQAGFSPGTSPLSALRSARELGHASPSPEQTRPLPQARDSAPSRSSLRATAVGRRSSTFIQPFKSPTVSASPLGASPLAGSPRTSTNRVPTLGSLTEEGGLPLPNAQVVAARNRSSLSAEQPLPSSLSTSPRQAPVRYASSFSHRRSRPSIDRVTSKTDDDQNSSGRGSTTSSTAPPGSGLLAEPGTAGTSSGSVQDDEENISDFLSMLDQKKDRLSQSDVKSVEAAARRTTAALNRYHRMRDTNAALSDSMSSSLMVQKSPQSSSRSLPLAAGPSSTSAASSPGKAISPHTPHTPFAPSRLSAAYSHEDAAAQQHLIAEEVAAAESSSQYGQRARPRPSTTIPAIDIPKSPRLNVFSESDRRSNSAQRPQVSSEDDIGDLYGMRTASIDTQDRKTRQHTPLRDTGAPNNNPDNARSNLISQQSAETTPRIPPINSDGAASDTGSGRSSSNNLNRFRRGSNLRSAASGTPPQISNSSFGASGANLERGGDSGGSGSSSWVRGGRPRPSTRSERPGTLTLNDDDDFLPFAIDKSDFHTTTRQDHGASER